MIKVRFLQRFFKIAGDFNEIFMRKSNAFQINKKIFNFRFFEISSSPKVKLKLIDIRNFNNLFLVISGTEEEKRRRRSIYIWKMNIMTSRWTRIAHYLIIQNQQKNIKNILKRISTMHNTKLHNIEPYTLPNLHLHRNHTLKCIKYMLLKHESVKL